MLMPDTEPTALRGGEATLQEIDDLLDEVSRLSLTESTPHEFHLQLLERAVRVLAAVGGGRLDAQRCGGMAPRFAG